MEGVRAKHALGRRRSLLGKRTRAFDVPAGEQRGCLAELPPRVMLALARRRETYRRREELGSGVRRAPPRGTERRFLDLSRSSLVGLRRRQRHVTRALLGILDERGEALVQLPAPLLRRRTVDRRGEQRMREADSFAIADEHARFLGLDECRGEVVLRRERSREDLNGRMRDGRRRERNLPCGDRQVVQSRLDELPEVSRNRKRLSGVVLAARRCERTGDLESEEGIAARGFGEAREQRPRERHADPRAHDVMQRCKRERPGRDALDTLFRKRPCEPEG